MKRDSSHGGKYSCSSPVTQHIPYASNINSTVECRVWSETRGSASNQTVTTGQWTTCTGSIFVVHWLLRHAGTATKGI